jgi:hypothetical protein
MQGATFLFADKLNVDLIRVTIISLMLTCLLFVPNVLVAQDLGKATLNVLKKDYNAYGSEKFYLDGELLMSVKNGENKECQFTPASSGTTTIKGVNYNAFGGIGSEFDYKFKIGPRGIAEIKDVWSGRFGDSFETHTYDVMKYGLDVSNLKVVLDNDSREREIAYEFVNTPRGAKRTVKRSRTIERSVSVTDVDTVEKELGAKVYIFSGAIRSKIERSRNTTYKESETIEQAVELDGNALPKAKLVWIERTYTGKATVSIDGKEAVVPFSFRENLELRVEEVQ